ncbi:MAG: hypothetical protein RH917_10670 [Lacipirellulaceae bacterium]
MHNLQLPDAQFEKLSQLAAATGYPDVPSYIDALVEVATFDPRGGMSVKQLRESAAECVSINERMKAGAEHDARQALIDLAKKRGLPSPQ